MINKIEYKSDIGYIPDTNGVDINAFNQGNLSDMYYLDTVHCVTKRKTYNRKCMYDIFGEYSNMTGDEVKAKLITELSENKEWYRMAGTCPLGMRGVGFDQWLKKLEKPRTWPDKLCLYGLCMIYRQHAIVFTATQPWCTVKVKENMTIGIVQEMCETVLLYLGNKLYGVLQCKPFSMKRPVTIDLDDTQRLRLMHHDHNLHKAYLEMRIDSVYEWYVCDEEIDELEPPKPVPNMTSPTVFDIDYVPIKQESSDSTEESTSAVIGHLLHQPVNVAKEIKQELINCAAHTIAGRHTESCEIAQFVSDKGCSWSTLQIEDVRSLLSAEEAVIVNELPVVLELSVVTEYGDTISPPHVTDYSSVLASECDKTSPTNQPLCVVTTSNENMTSQDTFYSEPVLEIVPATAGNPTHSSLHGVTPLHEGTIRRLLLMALADNQPEDTADTDPTLPMVTMENDRYVTILPDSFAEAGVDNSSNEPPTLSTIEPLHVVTDEHSLAPPELTPISITPVDDTSTVGYSEHTEHPEEPPEVGTNSSDAPDSATKSGPCMTSLPKHTTASVYYEVLTPEGDDVIYINRKDIMSKNCSVTLENLSASDIKELQERTKVRILETESTSDNQSSSEQKTTSDTDWVPSLKKKVTLSNRPCKAPSRARLAAQKMISHNRKHPVRKRQTPVYPIASSKKQVKDTQPDSDETIIYEPLVKQLLSQVNLPNQLEAKQSLPFVLLVSNWQRMPKL